MELLASLMTNWEHVKVYPEMITDAIMYVAVAVVLLVLFFKNKQTQVQKRQAIAAIYGNDDPTRWLALAKGYGEQWRSYQAAQLGFEQQQKGFIQRKQNLDETLQLLTGGKSLAESLTYWQQVLQKRQQHKETTREYERAKSHAEAIGAMAQPAPAPEEPDVRTESQAQTEQLLLQTQMEQRQLQQRLGQ